MRVLRAEVPRPARANRMAGEEDPRAVDGILAEHDLDDVEHVHLAELVGALRRGRDGRDLLVRGGLLAEDGRQAQVVAVGPRVPQRRDEGVAVLDGQLHQLPVVGVEVGVLVAEAAVQKHEHGQLRDAVPLRRDDDAVRKGGVRRVEAVAALLVALRPPSRRGRIRRGLRDPAGLRDRGVGVQVGAEGDAARGVEDLRPRGRHRRREREACREKNRSRHGTFPRRRGRPAPDRDRRRRRVDNKGSADGPKSRERSPPYPEKPGNSGKKKGLLEAGALSKGGGRCRT